MSILLSRKTFFICVLGNDLIMLVNIEKQYYSKHSLLLRKTVHNLYINVECIDKHKINNIIKPSLVQLMK